MPFQLSRSKKTSRRWKGGQVVISAHVGYGRDKGGNILHLVRVSLLPPDSVRAVMGRSKKLLVQTTQTRCKKVLYCLHQNKAARIGKRASSGRRKSEDNNEKNVRRGSPGPELTQPSWLHAHPFPPQRATHAEPTLRYTPPPPGCRLTHPWLELLFRPWIRSQEW